MSTDNTTTSVRAAVSAVVASGMSQASIAREAGISGATLSQWLKDEYRGDSSSIGAKIAAWLENREEGSAKVMPTVPEWVETDTSQAVTKTLLFAQHTASISVVYGGAGVGKTTAIRRYAEANPNVWIMTGSPYAGAMAGALEDVAQALGLKELSNRPSQVAREIVRRLTGTRGLLVVDEAQHLNVQALECMRALHDAAGVGLVLCGNEAVYSRLTGGSRKATFAQLFSRIGRRLHLTMPTDADVDAILTAWQVSGRKEREFALQVASLPGGLRGLMQTIRQASLAALGAGQTVDVRYLRASWRELGGES